MTSRKDRYLQSDILSIRLPSSTLNAMPFLQGPATNMFSEMTFKAGAAYDPLRNALSIDHHSGNLTLNLSLDRIQGTFNQKQLLKISTQKLLDALILKFTQVNSRRDDQARCEVSLSIEEYASMLGRPNTKSSRDEMRKSIRRDLHVLFAASIDWKDNSGNFLRTALFSAVGIKNSVIYVEFSPRMAQYLHKSYVMNYSLPLLQVDERNPNTYHLGRKLTTLAHINRNNGRDIASVSSLLKACPDLPAKEEAGTHCMQKIVVPFEKALESLEEKGILRWEYVTAEGLHPDDSQLHDMSYQLFISLYIRFQIL